MSYYNRRFRQFKLAPAELSDATMVSVEYLTSPDTIKKVLPPPLEPSSQPKVITFVAEYRKTNLPGVENYREAALFLEAAHEGVVGYYCLAMLLDDDAAMIGGREFFGFPKKIAAVTLSVNEDSFEATATRRGYQVLNLRGRIVRDKPSGVGPSPFDLPVYNFKYFPHPKLEGCDYSPRLVRSNIIESARLVLPAEVEFEFGRSTYDPWRKIGAEKILGAAYREFSITLPPGEFVAEVDADEFAPYSLNRFY